MNYKETIDWLYNQFPSYQSEGKTAYKKDITNVINFFKLHKEYYHYFRKIHVGGTNGKGSVSHMLSSILQDAGLKVGLFTSPHIIDFRERIKINNKLIDASFIIDFVEKYKGDFIKMKMSFFEMNVALAFTYFFYKKVDLAVIEVGLGGRLDATNIIIPELSIITNVSIDHANLLGKSLDLITAEKAGIIKRNRPVLVGEKNQHINIIKNKAQELNAPLFYSKIFKYDCQLKGKYQSYNVNTTVTAIEILNNIGYEISNHNIINGLNKVVDNTGLLGRWQTISENPTVICDIAHNVSAFKSLLSELEFSNKEKHIILGFSADKDYKDIISLLPINYYYYICGSSNNRVIQPINIVNDFKSYNLSYKIFDFSYSAYEFLSKNTMENDLIIITRSTFIVSDILKYLDNV